MNDKNHPKTYLNEKKYHNLHKISKIHLFYYFYCVRGDYLSKTKTILVVNPVKNDH